MEKDIKVFVVYSYDSEAHEKWVLQLVKELREKYGIDAVADKFLNINNLNKIMIDKIRTSDKIIMVVTQKYTEKFDKYQKNVGFEADLIVNRIKEDGNSVIVIKREECNLPFIVRGYQYIDFINDINNSNMEKLVQKIKNLPEYELPNIKEEKKVLSKQVPDDEDIIPNLRVITEQDRSDEIKRMFEEITVGITRLLQKTKDNNSNFDFNIDENFVEDSNYSMYSKKEKIKVYYFNLLLNGKSVYKYKLWCMIDGHMRGVFGTPNYAYDSNTISGWSFQVSIIEDNKKFIPKLIMSPLFKTCKDNIQDIIGILFDDMKSHLK